MYSSDTIALPTKVAIVFTTTVARRAKGHRDCGFLYRSRRRALGTQGRREKAALVKDLLFSWFCLIRRSVRSRIPPKLMIAKASMLMGEYIDGHTVGGCEQTRR